MKWKREADGSYTSEAGRIWRFPGEKWEDYCIAPAFPVTHHSARVGNLTESKELLERLWSRHLRKTGPLPKSDVMLAAFKGTLRFAGDDHRAEIFAALIVVVEALPVALTAPALAEALGKWWRATA